MMQGHIYIHISLSFSFSKSTKSYELRGIEGKYVNIFSLIMSTDYALTDTFSNKYSIFLSELNKFKMKYNMRYFAMNMFCDEYWYVVKVKLFDKYFFK